MFVTLWHELDWWARKSVRELWPKLWGDYCRVTAEPVDLGKIYRELVEADVVRARVFSQRCELLLKNALSYNGDTTKIVQDAQVVSTWLFRYHTACEEHGYHISPNDSCIFTGGRKGPSAIPTPDGEYRVEKREKLDARCEQLWQNSASVDEEWRAIRVEVRGV